MTLVLWVGARVCAFVPAFIAGLVVCGLGIPIGISALLWRRCFVLFVSAHTHARAGGWERGGVLIAWWSNRSAVLDYSKQPQHALL